MAELLLQTVASQAKAAKAALSRSKILNLRHLTVEQDGGCVVLRGSVNSYYHKQLAQELVRSAIATAEVMNEVHVVYSPDDRFDW